MSPPHDDDQNETLAGGVEYSYTDVNSMELLYTLNRSLHQPYYALFVTLYSLVILAAFVGNALIISTVGARVRELAVPRNILIINLAAADLLVCLSMLLTSVDVLTKYWPLGRDTIFLCRVAKAGPCFAVYYSSFAVVAIAVDRHRCIVHSDSKQMTVGQCLRVILTMAVVSLLFASPIFLNTHFHIPILDTDTTAAAAADYESQDMALESTASATTSSTRQSAVDEEEGSDDFWEDLVFCIEDFQFGGVGNTTVIASNDDMRHYYSVFSLCIQFLLPFTAISTLYTLIFFYLRRHRIIKTNCTASEVKARRTNVMLASISFAFCFCWLPLNLFCVVADSTDLAKGMDSETMITIYICCHLIGMASTVFNPVMYGYRNEHLRHDALQVARNILAKGLGLTIKRTAATATAESRLTNGRATFQADEIVDGSGSGGGLEMAPLVESASHNGVLTARSAYSETHCQVATLKRGGSSSSATTSTGRGSQKLKARSATFSEEHLSPGVKISHVDARIFYHAPSRKSLKFQPREATSST